MPETRHLYIAETRHLHFAPTCCVLTGTFGPIDIGAYVFELADGSAGLVDAGMDPDATEIKGALSRMGKTSDDVKAILITHRHNDHVAGAAGFPRAVVYVLEPDLEAVRRRPTAPEQHGVSMMGNG